MLFRGIYGVVIILGVTHFVVNAARCTTRLRSSKDNAQLRWLLAFSTTSTVQRVASRKLFNIFNQEHLLESSNSRFLSAFKCVLNSMGFLML